jgi:hypothetical protein
MSAYSLINDSKAGYIKIITQQYEVGLYVAIYSSDEQGNSGSLQTQFGVNTDEWKYHKKVREKAGENFVEGTDIDLVKWSNTYDKLKEEVEDTPLGDRTIFVKHDVNPPLPMLCRKTKIEGWEDVPFVIHHVAMGIESKAGTRSIQYCRLIGVSERTTGKEVARGINIRNARERAKQTLDFHGREKVMGLINSLEKINK